MPNAGHLTSVYIADGRPRTVSFVKDANGLILLREENDNYSSHGDPRDWSIPPCPRPIMRWVVEHPALSIAASHMY